MSITYTLPNFRLISQLSEPTQDTYPDENARNNCVVASLSMALDYLTGGNYDGDELKDAVYGQGYIGPMSAAKYEAYCAARGVTLAPHDGSQSDLIATIHAEVDAGHPVVLTMPSQWGTAPADPVHPSGSTHVGVAYGTGPGMIRVANPWGGFNQDESDAWWQARLCYGQVWPMRKASTNVSGVPSGWTDDGVTLKAPNGVPVVHGMRAFVLANSWDASDVPLAPEDDSMAQVEIGNPSLGGGAVQWFEKSGQLSWTAAKGVFRTYNGQEERALRKALDSANANAYTQAAMASAAQNSLAAANSQIAQLQAQITALKSQPAPAPSPVANPAPTTPADAAALLVSLIYAEAQATLKAVTPA